MVVLAPPQGFLSVSQLNTLGLPAAIPATGNFTTINPGHGTLLYSGNEALISSLGAFFPNIKTAAVMPPNIASRSITVAADVRVLDGTVPFFPFFAEPVKADFNDFLGFEWDGISSLFIRTRRSGSQQLTTLTKTPAYMQLYHQYRIVYQRTSVEFLIDGVSVATHTTNISPPPHCWEAGEVNGVVGTCAVKFPFIYVYPDDPGGTLPGAGIPMLYGVDNRTGIVAADGAPITLYTVNADSNHIYRITADIFATAVSAGTANYTVTWTENAQAKTMVVSASVINTLATATDLINPDASTAITAQLTFAGFTGTVKVASVVEELA